MIAYHPMDPLIYLPPNGHPLRAWVSNTSQPASEAGWLRVCWPLEDAQAGRFTIAETKHLRPYSPELWARCEAYQQEKQKQRKRLARMYRELAAGHSTARISPEQPPLPNLLPNLDRNP